MERIGTRRNFAVGLSLLAVALVVAGCNLNDSLGVTIPAGSDARTEAAPGLQWDPVSGKPYLPLPPDAQIAFNPEAGDLAPSSSAASPPTSRSIRSVSPSSSVASTNQLAGTPTPEPASLDLTLRAGESCDPEHQTASIPGAPPKGDVLFAIDLTAA